MRKLLPVILIVSVCFSCAKTPVPASPESDLSGEADIVQGMVLVKFSAEMASRIERGESLSVDIGVLSMERLFPDAGEFEQRTREAGLHRWYKVHYSSAVPATKAAADLLSIPGVEISEAKRRVKNTAYFNDPYLGMMWHLNDGKTPTASINVIPVWQSFTTGSSNVIVGIIDGGIQTDHPDLAGSVIPGGIDGSRNFVDNGFVIAAHSHGTHVGGTIGAISNNGTGISGIAGGNAAAGIDGVRLLSCQIFKTVDGKDQGGDTAAAIKWAADHGATIINNSWGYDFDKNGNNRIDGDEIAAQLSATVDRSDKEAIDYFIAKAGYDADGNQIGPMAGGVVFFAAGNESLTNGAPANYEPVVAVGATNAFLQRASFSNYGDWVDIAAPGEDIYSTYPTNTYAKLQGTSMACPHVTGVAALLLSYYGGKGFTNTQLIDMLVNGANPDVLPAGSKIGPLLDAMGSFTYSSPGAPAAVSSIEASASGNRISLTFDVTGNSDGLPAYSYLLVASKDRSLVEGFDPFTATPSALVTATAVVGPAKVGDSFTAYIDKLDFEQRYYCAVIAASYQKKYSALSDIITVSTTENHAPVVTIVEAGPFMVKASEEFTIHASVLDPDGHAVDISFDGGSAAADYKYDSSTGTLSIIIRGRRADAGNYTATIIAKDSYGLSAEFDIKYTILENEPPVATGSLDDVIVYDKNKALTFNLEGLFTDPEGEAITYKVRGNNVSLLKIDIAGSIIKATPKAYGLSRLTIVAVDAANKECAIPLNILVKNPENVAESYPNPVIDKLTIRTEKEADTHIVLTNATGAVVFDKTIAVSGFNPAVLDMTGCAPGRYVLEISYSGKSFSRTIIKK